MSLRAPVVEMLCIESKGKAIPSLRVKHLDQKTPLNKRLLQAHFVSVPTNMALRSARVALATTYIPGRYTAQVTFLTLTCPHVYLFMEIIMRTIHLFLVVILLVTGCGNSSSTATPSLPPTAETPNTLPEPTDPTQLITVQAGETFDIIVPSNSSTGYRWMLVSELEENVVEFLAQEYIAEQPVIPGSGGVDVWTFRSVNAGDTTIELGYYPPANETEPEETVIFSITVE